VTKGKQQSKLLMIDAINLIGTDNIPSTVVGIKRAIHKVISSTFPTLSEAPFGTQPAFDTVACLKCDKAIKTTDDAGKVSYHCLDSECWNLQQRNALRKREEDDQAKAKAEWEEREAAKAAAAAAPNPPPIPQGKPRLPTIKVDPKRLTEGGDIFESYTREQLVAKITIKPPFEEAGVTYVSAGDYLESDLPDAKQAYRLIPRSEFTGELKYMSGLKGPDAQKFRESLLADPLGPFNGALAVWKGEEHVLVGPAVVFEPWAKSPAAAPEKEEPETEETETEGEDESSTVATTGKTTEAAPPAAGATTEAVLPEKPGEPASPVGTKYRVSISYIVSVDPDEEIKPEDLRGTLYELWEEANDEDSDRSGSEAFSFTKES
jgi:hypothetical protein